MLTGWIVVCVLFFLAGVPAGMALATWLGRGHDRKVAGHWQETPPPYRSLYEEDAE